MKIPSPILQKSKNRNICKKSSSAAARFHFGDVHEDRRSYNSSGSFWHFNPYFWFRSVKFDWKERKRARRRKWDGELNPKEKQVITHQYFWEVKPTSSGSRWQYRCLFGSDYRSSTSETSYLIRKQFGKSYEQIRHVTSALTTEYSMP